MNCIRLNYRQRRDVRFRRRPHPTVMVEGKPVPLTIIPCGQPFVRSQPKPKRTLCA